MIIRILNITINSYVSSIVQRWSYGVAKIGYELTKSNTWKIILLFTQVYAFSGAKFFCNLLPKAECVLFDDCGHFLAIDKPEETAESILTFFDNHANYQVKLLSVTDIKLLNWTIIEVSASISLCSCWQNPWIKCMKKRCVLMFHFCRFFWLSMFCSPSEWDFRVIFSAYVNFKIRFLTCDPYNILSLFKSKLLTKGFRVSCPVKQRFVSCTV
jgi:hypothetical protein